MIEAHQRHPIRILSNCVSSNHWHLVVWPEADGQVTASSRWLAHTHAMHGFPFGCIIIKEGRWRYEESRCTSI